MELLVATGIGLLFASGTYLLLRARTFSVVIGLTLLAYGVNAMLFAMGRLAVDKPPVLVLDLPAYSDPLPQALVLTAIVIAFGMTAFAVVLILRGFLEVGSDHVDGAEPADPGRRATYPDGSPIVAAAAAPSGPKPSGPASSGAAEGGAAKSAGDLP
jgi:multicomponent K+:H+ antiporter subunit C